MRSDDSAPIWKRIRDTVAGGHCYYLNLPPDASDAYVDHLLEADLVTLSDWGLAETAGVRFTEDGDVVTPDTAVESFGDPIAGQLNWETIRDTIDRELFGEADTKVKAGRVAASIRRFVEGMAEGDFVFVREGDCVRPAVVRGPARYDLSSKSYELTGMQAFYREVEWARIDGELVEIPRDSLPPGFGPGRQTIGELRDPSPVVGLLQAFEWIAEY
jgi:hypothetical protein